MVHALTSLFFSCAFVFAGAVIAGMLIEEKAAVLAALGLKVDRLRLTTLPGLRPTREPVRLRAVSRQLSVPQRRVAAA